MTLPVRRKTPVCVCFGGEECWILQERDPHGGAGSQSSVGLFAGGCIFVGLSPSANTVVVPCSNSVIHKYWLDFKCISLKVVLCGGVSFVCCAAWIN